MAAKYLLEPTHMAKKATQDVALCNFRKRHRVMAFCAGLKKKKHQRNQINVVSVTREP